MPSINGPDLAALGLRCFTERRAEKNRIGTEFAALTGRAPLAK